MTTVGCVRLISKMNFELSPELLKSLGLDTLEKPYHCRLTPDAIPTIFYCGSLKARCQVKGKQTFSKIKTKGKVKTKFRGQLSPEISRLSPRKKPQNWPRSRSLWQGIWSLR